MAYGVSSGSLLRTPKPHPTIRGGSSAVALRPPCSSLPSHQLSRPVSQEQPTLVILPSLFSAVVGERYACWLTMTWCSAGWNARLFSVHTAAGWEAVARWGGRQHCSRWAFTVSQVLCRDKGALINSFSVRVFDGKHRTPKLVGGLQRRII